MNAPRELGNSLTSKEYDAIHKGKIAGKEEECSDDREGVLPDVCDLS